MKTSLRRWSCGFLAALLLLLAAAAPAVYLSHPSIY